MILTIPRNSIFRPLVNTFTATYNSPTVGQYNWAIAANTDQQVMQINSQNLFFISIINFSTTLPEGDFLSNILTVPQIRFRTKQANQSLFGGAYPLGKYLINNEIAAFFQSKQDKDNLVATFTGSLGQNADLIAVSSVKAVVALNVFEISDAKFIAEFNGHVAAGKAIGNVQIPPDLVRRI